MTQSIDLTFQNIFKADFVNLLREPQVLNSVWGISESIGLCDVLLKTQFTRLAVMFSTRTNNFNVNHRSYV